MAVRRTLPRLVRVQSASFLLYRGVVELERRSGTVFFSGENCENVLKTERFLSPRLERPGTAYFANTSLLLYLFFVSFQTELRPRWPSDKVSAKEPEGYRFETRFH
ncbi:hypothetical protein AVEN_273682-1 [Araneus ventricosus]|uniref:Uncharacterized protein n=1 Tax=Araneus ventricosus TaxID=182803 RepID=A0A4Y2MNC3_ARAVE|nr:hypothetical protein AVEN_273682-1 [Araneus ventricosus]